MVEFLLKISEALRIRNSLHVVEVIQLQFTFYKYFCRVIMFFLIIEGTQKIIKNLLFVFNNIL